MGKSFVVTFKDGTKRAYEDAPDDLTPDAAEARVKTDYPGKEIVGLKAISPGEVGGKAAGQALFDTRRTKTVGDLVTEIPEALGNVSLSALSGATGGRSNAMISALTPGDTAANRAQLEATQSRPAMEAAKFAGAGGVNVFAGNLLARGAAGLAPSLISRLPAAAPYVNRMTSALGSGGFSLGPNAGKGFANALINAPIRALGGAIPAGLSAFATAPGEEGNAALVGAGLPLVGAPAGALISKVYSNIKGRVQATEGTIPAAQIIRAALAEEFEPAMRALRAAPNDGRTATQVLQDAGIPAPAFMGIANVADNASPSVAYDRLFQAQRDTQEQILASLSGGTNQTAARAAADETKDLVNEITTPMRQTELAAANAGAAKAPLEAEAARMNAAAAASVDDVRRLVPLSERTAAKADQLADIRNSVGGVEPGVAENRAVDQALQASNLADAAADRSLSFGGARNLSQYQADSLAAYGLRPLDTSSLVGQIDRLLKNPSIAGDAVGAGVINKVRNDIAKWTAENGGTISADALYGIRKNAVSQEVARLMSGQDPNAVRRNAARLTASIQPQIDNAIEAAGGVKWREYLATHAAGMKNVERQQMAAVAQDLYRKNPEEFVALIRGNNDEAVEKIFGSGRYDLAKEMGADQYAQLKRVADEVARDLGIAADMGRKTEKGLSVMRATIDAPTQFPRVARAVRATNDLSQLLNAATTAETKKKLFDALQSGQSAAQLVDRLTALELKRLNGVGGWKNIWNKASGSVGLGFSGGVSAGVNRPAYNFMAPENQNAMAE
jgi:hypothetical protein